MRGLLRKVERAKPLPGPAGSGDVARAVHLQASVRAEVLEAEDELTAVRYKMYRLSAGIRDAEDIPPLPVEAPPVAVAATRARAGFNSWALAVFVGGLALTGTVAALGGARALATMIASPEVPLAPNALTAAPATDQAARPTTAAAVAADDPGVSIYAARFSKVSAAEKACLARAIYFEARGESFEGQVAVAQVVLNRARSRKWPSTLCRVVYQGIERGEKCQFSFACMRHTEPSGDLWDEAQAIAEQAVTGHAWLREAVEATYYHATSVAPVWRVGLVATGTIGSHVFYRDPNGLREASAAKFAAGVLPLRQLVHKPVATAALSQPAAVPTAAVARPPAVSTSSVTRIAPSKVQETKVQASIEAKVAVERKKAAVTTSDANWNTNLLQPRF